MRSAVSILSLTALLPALLALLFLATPAAADPDDDEGGGCPPGGCVNVYEPEPTTDPDPPAHGGDGGCCGATHAPQTHAPDPTHAPAPAPEPIVVVPAQPVPAQPRSRPRATAPAAGFVPADAPVAPQGVLDLNATTRGSGEVQRVQVIPAASGSGLPGDMPPWVPIAGGLLVAAGAAAALGGGGAPSSGGGPAGGAPAGGGRPAGTSGPPAGWHGSTHGGPPAWGPAGIAAAAGPGGAPPWPDAPATTHPPQAYSDVPTLQNSPPQPWPGDAAAYANLNAFEELATGGVAAPVTGPTAAAAAHPPTPVGPPPAQAPSTPAQPAPPEPPVAEPPVAEAPATEPPATEFPATESPTTTPPTPEPGPAQDMRPGGQAEQLKRLLDESP